MPLIHSLLDTDQYKFSMLQATLHQCPGVETEWEFINRGGHDLTPLRNKVRDEIQELCHLSLQSTDIQNLHLLMPFLSKDFFSYLEHYRLSCKYIQSGLSGETSNLFVNTAGPELQTSPFEIFVLAIISELWYRHILTPADYSNALQEGLKRTQKKIEYLKKEAPPEFRFADFGTRRRFSKEHHETVLQWYMREVPHFFVGTSNLMFAAKYAKKAIGTQAHQWFMMNQSLVRLADSQKYALQTWADEYRGKLGIALTDTIGLKAFLKDFDDYFAKLYDGVRQDSGNAYTFADQMIGHYSDLGIDPRTKTIVFSNALDFEKAIDLTEMYSDEIGVSHGIGGFVTNDMGLDKSMVLNIVMKMLRSNGKAVAKITDDPGKGVCKDDLFMTYLKAQFNVA